MKHHLFRPVALLAVFGAIAAAYPLVWKHAATADAAGQDPRPSAPAPAGDASAEQAIRKANAELLAAMNKADLDGIMAFWSADADYIDESGKQTRGKEAITELYRKVLPSLKTSKITGKSNAIKLLRPDIAVEDGTLEFTDENGTTDTNRYAAVWVRSDGKWQITSARDLPAEVIEMPSLAYGQLRALEWLVGEWTAEAAGKQVAIKISWDRNKTFLLGAYTVKQEGAEPMDVTMRVGWDGYNGVIRSWVFDSNGGIGEGYWEKDGNRWIVSTAGILPDGGSGSATNVFTYVDDNSFTWQSLDREVDGLPLPDSQVKFTRKAAGN